MDGGLNGFGQAASVWQDAEALARVEPVGIGLGFLSDPAPLIERACSLGVDEVIVRLEWARLEPRRGAFDRRALARCAELLEAIRSSGLAVGISLSDGTAPAWFGGEGWLTPAAPETFARYAAAVGSALGDQIASVFTLEEPALWAMAGWMSASAPPFRRLALPDALAVLDNMMAGHLLAMTILKDAIPAVEVTVVPSNDLAFPLEREILGLGMSTVAAPLVKRWSPGRAKAMASTTSLGGDVLSLGRDSVRWTGGAVGLLTRRMLSEETVFDAPSLAGVLGAKASEIAPGPFTVAYRHRCATVDERGRRRNLSGHLREHELIALADAVVAVRRNGGRIHRVILGDLTDRWRWGTYGARSGIFGVDRTRGPQGFRLLETDASGVNAAAAIRSAIAALRDGKV